MSTTVRPEISKKSKYWIERHRYYELKHFCLQYPIWKKAYQSLDSMVRFAYDVARVDSNKISNPVEDCAEAREFYYDRMKMVESAAKETDEYFGSYILRAVTEGLSFDCLHTKYGIPCCKDTYYNLYRRFFYLLSQLRK